MRSAERRLRTIARRAQLCPDHLQPLVCHTCTTVWTGSHEAWQELQALLRVIEPYYPPLRPQGQCDRGHPMLCEACWQEDARASLGSMGDEVISSDELTRMTELLRHFKRSGRLGA